VAFLRLACEVSWRSTASQSAQSSSRHRGSLKEHSHRSVPNNFMMLGRGFGIVRRRLAISAAPRQGLLGEYKALVSQGKFLFDEKQWGVLKYLNRLNDHLSESKKANEEEVIVYPGIQSDAQARGVYIYGEVGTGKSFLMDLFFAHCKLGAGEKRRVHFHAFMLEVHQRVFQYKQELLRKHGRDVNINLSSERDAIANVAQAISQEARLLCFDEFQVTDVADAMIIAKLFSVLWKNGTVLVATSNRPPEDLYKDGLNRSYFLPFIHDLQKLTIVRDMGSSVDYRQSNAPLANSFFTPANDENKDRLRLEFMRWGGSGDGADGGGVVDNAQVPVMMGRRLTVQLARPSVGACFVSFSSLCEADLGASDYRALATNYKAVFLHGVPQLSVLEHDRARRFITLVDCLYDAGRILVWTADEPPASLFKFLSPDDKENLKPLGTDHRWSGAAGDVGGWRYTTAVDHSKFGAKVSVSASPRIVPRVDTGVTTTRHTAGTVSAAVGAGVDAAQEELKLLEGELSSVQELAFAFRRAASRLVEMAGAAWRESRVSQ